jgi:PAS domain S-box-containing protein
LDEKGKQGNQNRHVGDLSEVYTQDRFHIIHDRAAVGIARARLDGRIIDVNQKLADMLGYTRDELVERPVAELVHPDDWAREQEQLARLKAGETPSYSIEERYQCKDGRVIWGNTVSWLALDAHPPYRVVVVEDITAQKQARQRIEELGAIAEENRAKLEAVISSMSDGVSIYDAQGRLVLASRAGLAMLGYASFDEAPKDVARYPEVFELEDLSGRTLPLEEWPILRSLRGDVFRNIEIRVKRKDISLTKIGSFSGGPVRDAKGQIILGVVTAQDITQRYAVEMERARLLEEAQRLAQELEARNTDLQRANELTEIERRRYQELFEFAPDGYIVTDEQGVIREANSAAGRLLGTPVEQIVGDRLESYVPKDQLWLFHALVDHLREVGQVNDWELLLQPRGGEVFPAAVTVATVAETLELRWSIRDIRQRAEADKAVREAEERFRSVLDNVREGIQRLNLRSGRYDLFSPSMEAITGFTLAELREMTPAQVDERVHPDDREAYLRYKRQAQTAPQATREPIEFRWQVRDGTYRWFSLNLRLALDEEERALALVGVVRDITQRKEAQQAVQESEARLREVLENAQDIIYRIDLSTNRLEYVSAVSEHITGYLREQLINMTRQDIISLLHPDDQPLYYARTKALWESDEERPRDRADYRWKAGEGKYRWFDLSRTLIRDDKGQPQAIVVSARDVTEQKEAEFALRDSERKLRNLIDNSTDGISLLDESGVVVEWNPSLERITGIPKEQALGMRMSDILFGLLPEQAQAEPNMRERVHGQVMNLLQTGQGDWLNRIMDGQVRRPDGTRRDVQVVMFPIKTERGWMVGSVARDVTEQKKAEQALRESEARLREVLENSRDAIYRYDVQAARYEYFSPAIQDISGFAPEELLQMDIEDLLEHIHPEDRANYLAHNEALIHSKEERPADRVEYRWKSKQGRYCWMSVQRALVRNGDGKPVAHVGAIRDITEQKKAEQARAESEARLREVIMNSQDAIYRIDFKTGCYDFFSPSAEAITGFSMQEMIDMGLDGVLARVHPDDRAIVQRRLQEEAEHPDENRRPMEYRWRVKSGEWHWFSDSRRLITNERGEPEALVVVGRDITEQRQAEELIRQSEARLKELTDTLEQRVAERTVQLRALASELSRAEERERRRLARVLHDHLQQLLVAARLSVNTLQRRLTEASLQQTAEQLDQVLGEAIDTSRSLTAELSPPVLYDAGLGPALHWLSRWMQEKHGLLVDVDAEDLHNVTPENIRAMLFQAARELLFNVVKHAGVNRATVRLRRLAGDELELVVTDQGAGFDPEKVGRAEEGGFGLFSIQERLEMVGGRMDVQSAPGQGTRVTLRVPMYPMAVEAATVAAEEAAGRLTRVSEAEARAAQREAAPTGERPIRVLLADDHVIVRQGLARLLQDEPGIELVGEADDGREALALTQMVHPDVVLMDVSMPTMDGVEATRRILAEQPDVKVIGLSMYKGEEMAEHMRQAGAMDYVSKGGDPAMLIRAVRRAAGQPVPQA